MSNIIGQFFTSDISQQVSEYRTQALALYHENVNPINEGFSAATSGVWLTGLFVQNKRIYLLAAATFFLLSRMQIERASYNNHKWEGRFSSEENTLIYIYNMWLGLLFLRGLNHCGVLTEEALRSAYEHIKAVRRPMNELTNEIRGVLCKTNEELLSLSDQRIEELLPDDRNNIAFDYISDPQFYSNFLDLSIFDMAKKRLHVLHGGEFCVVPQEANCFTSKERILTNYHIVAQQFASRARNVMGIKSFLKFSIRVLQLQEECFKNELLSRTGTTSDTLPQLIKVIHDNQSVFQSPANNAVLAQLSNEEVHFDNRDYINRCLARADRSRKATIDLLKTRLAGLKAGETLKVTSTEASLILSYVRLDLVGEQIARSTIPAGLQEILVHPDTLDLIESYLNNQPIRRNEILEAMRFYLKRVIENNKNFKELFKDKKILFVTSQSMVHSFQLLEIDNIAKCFMRIQEHIQVLEKNPRCERTQEEICNQIDKLIKSIEVSQDYFKNKKIFSEELKFAKDYQEKYKSMFSQFFSFLTS